MFAGFSAVALQRGVAPGSHSPGCRVFPESTQCPVTTSPGARSPALPLCLPQQGSPIRSWLQNRDEAANVVFMEDRSSAIPPSPREAVAMSLRLAVRTCWEQPGERVLGAMPRSWGCQQQPHRHPPSAGPRDQPGCPRSSPPCSEGCCWAWRQPAGSCLALPLPASAVGGKKKSAAFPSCLQPAVVGFLLP